METTPSIAAVVPGDFYCLVEEEKRGPFDLIELAAQLRTSKIEVQTRVFRAGETEGRALGELPEYAQIRDMPIETIARHLEEKERVASPDRPRSSAVYVFIGVGLILVVVAIAILSQPLSLAPAAAPFVKLAPPVDPWQQTGGSGFTVECLAPLRLVPATVSPGVLSYRANVPGAGFGVDMQVVGGNAPPDEIKSVINAMRDQMLASLNGQFISETSFVVTGGFYRKQVIFSHDYSGHKMAGAVCVIGGPDRLAAAWAVARSTQVGYDEVEHYVNSFELH